MPDASALSNRSPVLRLVTRLLSEERDSGKTIPPKRWILQLLEGLKLQISEAGLIYEGHHGTAGCAFLRDPLGGGDERPITRFRAAREFLEEALTAIRERLSEHPQDASAKDRLFMRHRLLDWIREAESLYEQQHAPGGAAVAPPAARKPTPVAAPLSFPNETQRNAIAVHLQRQVTAAGVAAGEQEGLAYLGKVLCRLQPDVEALIERTLKPATTLGGAVCNVYSTLSEPSVSNFEKTWLSELGSLLIELKRSLDDIETPSDPGEEPSNEADAVDDAFDTDDLESDDDTGLTPMLRQAIKLEMTEAFESWPDAGAVLDEHQCLEQLALRLVPLEIGARLRACLEADRFLEAGERVEALDAESGPDGKLKRQLAMLLQELQTAYFQRLRSMLGIAFFTDPEARQEALSVLVDQWQSDVEDGQGDADTRALQADANCLALLIASLRDAGVDDACESIIADTLAIAESLDEAHSRLIESAPRRPVAALFRSQLRGFVEDIALRRSFAEGHRPGWLTVIRILSKCRPVSESELTAVLARKIDAMGGTEAHVNFLNPSRDLRLSQFAQWVRDGYRMSPSYSDSEEEQAILSHLGWALGQLTDLAQTAGRESGFDAFLSAEADNDYRRFAEQVEGIAQRFEAWYQEWQSKPV